MATFKDAQDREWKVALEDARQIQRIREECDPDFLKNDFANGADDNTFARLQSDPVLLCRVIFLLCEKQRVERGISEEGFYLGVIGDAIESATNALLAAIKAFYPRRIRELLEVFADQDILRQQAVEKAAARISDPELRAEIQQAMENQIDLGFKTLMTQLSSATTTPGSSESPPSA